MTFPHPLGLISFREEAVGWELEGRRYWGELKGSEGREASIRQDDDQC